MVVAQSSITELLRCVNANKAPGPDGIWGRILHYCAELSEVLYSNSL